MKKLFLISVILCLVATAHAQIRFGVKAGGNFSNLYVSGDRTGINNDQYKGRLGYHFGGVMEYSISEMFAIQPELMYLNHGANLKKNNSFEMDDAHVMLNTLQLPVNIKMKFALGNTRAFVFGGPYIAYNMYGKVKGKQDGKSVDEELFKKGSDLKRWDYGVGIGAGIEVNKFVLTLGNQIGICDINDASGSKMKAGNITLSVGYFF